MRYKNPCDVCDVCELFYNSQYKIVKKIEVICCLYEVGII